MFEDRGGRDFNFVRGLDGVVEVHLASGVQSLHSRLDKAPPRLILKDLGYVFYFVNLLGRSVVRCSVLVVLVVMRDDVLVSDLHV